MEGASESVSAHMDAGAGAAAATSTPAPPEIVGNASQAGEGFRAMPEPAHSSTPQPDHQPDHPSGENTNQSAVDSSSRPLDTLSAPSSTGPPTASDPSLGSATTKTTPSLPSHDHHNSPAIAAAVVPHFVAPSSYLRLKPSRAGLTSTSILTPVTSTTTAPSAGTTSTMAAAAADSKSPSPLDRDQRQGLKAIRDFLRVRTSYDVLPLSFRLIVLDTDLLIKKSLNILIQNSIVSAPLWDSHTSKFAGLLTSTEYINVIQYYCQFPDEISKLDQFRLSSLRDIEKAIGAIPIETLSVHPSRPLFEACSTMLKTRARRIPLVDVDDETGEETVVSVITQYRILKFIAVNNEHNTVLLKKTVREIGLGTYENLATVPMNSTVLDAIHIMVDRNISCIPIVDEQNRVLNAFEAIDVIPCIKGGAYEELDGTVGEALCRRPDDSPGIYSCGENDRLDSIFDTIRKSRVHRLIVVDDENRLKGVISLSDILKYVLLWGEEGTGDRQISMAE